VFGFVCLFVCLLGSRDVSFAGHVCLFVYSLGAFDCFVCLLLSIGSNSCYPGHVSCYLESVYYYCLKISWFTFHLCQ